MKTIAKTIAIFIFISLSTSAFAVDVLKHTLEKGETLYSISRQFKVSYEALAAANGITDPTKLKIGTVLIIPSVHVVEKGETFFGLTRLYGVTMNDLLAANKLSPDYVLKIGDTLVIPGVKAASESSASPLTIPSTTTTVAGPAVTVTTTAAAKTATTLATSPSKTTATTLTPAKPTITVVPAKPVETTAAPAKPVETTVTTANGGNGKVFSVGPQTGSSAPANGTANPAGTYIPMPDPVKTQDRAVDMKLGWPVPGKAMYLDGKLEGIMIRVKPGETSNAIASGTVVSAGPSRGFNQVVFVQAKSGYVYVYGGNETLSVKTGDQVASGKELGKIGIDAKDGSPIAYFFVFRNGQPIDPALAPRD